MANFKREHSNRMRLKAKVDSDMKMNFLIPYGNMIFYIYHYPIHHNY